MNFLKNQGVDIDNSLELLGDIETYNDILNDFYVELDDRVNSLDGFKSDNDMENYSILVHTMKSDSKYLGFNKLSSMCLEHQLKSEDKDLKYINDNFEDLVKEINNIKKIISKYLEGV